MPLRRRKGTGTLPLDIRSIQTPPRGPTEQEKVPSPGASLTEQLGPLGYLWAGLGVVVCVACVYYYPVYAKQKHENFMFFSSIQVELAIFSPVNCY